MFGIHPCYTTWVFSIGSFDKGSFFPLYLSSPFTSGFKLLSNPDRLPSVQREMGRRWMVIASLRSPLPEDLNSVRISWEMPLLGPPNRVLHCEEKGQEDKGIRPHFSPTKDPQYFYSAENRIIFLGLLWKPFSAGYLRHFWLFLCTREIFFFRGGRTLSLKWDINAGNPVPT